jgi:hypothetical protein
MVSNGKRSHEKRVLRGAATVSQTVAPKKQRTALETESAARALEVFVNQYDWLRGPLTFRVVKRRKFSEVGIVGVTL